MRPSSVILRGRGMVTRDARITSHLKPSGTDFSLHGALAAGLTFLSPTGTRRGSSGISPYESECCGGAGRHRIAEAAVVQYIAMLLNAEKVDGVTVIDLPERINSSNNRAFEKDVTPLMDENPRLIFDLAHVAQ